MTKTELRELVEEVHELNKELNNSNIMLSEANTELLETNTELLKFIANQEIRLASQEGNEDLKELADRVNVFELWIIEQDMVQQFEEYIDNSIKFHAENNDRYLEPNHTWDLELRMVRDLKSV